MKNFGCWVRFYRVQQGLDLRSLQALSGVDFSSINRLENGETEPTLITAVRLWLALAVPLSELIGDLKIICNYDTLPNLANQQNQTLLELGDLTQYIKLGFAKPEQMCALNKQLIEQVSNTCQENGRIFPALFSPDNFETALVDYPNSTVMTIEQLIECYQNGGAWVFGDAGAYFRLLRQQSKASLVDVEEWLKLSDTILNRIERGVILNVKLKDILKINNMLDDTGRLFVLYWMAATQTITIKSIITGYSSRRDALKLWPIEQAAYNLVHAFRWLANLSESQVEFLSLLRCNIF